MKTHLNNSDNSCSLDRCGDESATLLSDAATTAAVAALTTRDASSFVERNGPGVDGGAITLPIDGDCRSLFDVDDVSVATRGVLLVAAVDATRPDAVRPLTERGSSGEARGVDVERRTSSSAGAVSRMIVRSSNARNSRRRQRRSGSTAEKITGRESAAF